jgi:hypothetical protein
MRQTNLKTARRACVALAAGLLLLAPAFGPTPRVESPAVADARAAVAPTVGEWLKRPVREELARTLRTRETGPGGEQLALNDAAPARVGAR